MSKRAIYKDAKGRTYSSAVVFHDGQWMMTTSEGLAPITFYFDDDAGGRLEFVEYREVPEEDLRLHVDPVPPLGDSFAAIRLAGERATAEYRAQRERERRAMLEQANQPDPQIVQQRSAAREIRNQYAAAMTKKIGD